MQLGNWKQCRISPFSLSLDLKPVNSVDQKYTHNRLSYNYILRLQTLNTKRVCATKTGIFLRICLGLWS